MKFIAIIASAAAMKMDGPLDQTFGAPKWNQW